MLKITKQETLYRDGEYVAFPCMARLPDGKIICAFRHALDRQKEYGLVTHVDPTARAVYIVSEDNGKTFSSVLHVIEDDEMSEQDPCVNVLSDGRIIVTYFRWELAPIGTGASRWGRRDFRRYGRSLAGIYDCYPDGVAYSISDDGGATWRNYPHIRVKGVSPTGGVRGNIIEMPDGSLLMPCYGCLNYGELARSCLIRSVDRGETWSFLSVMAFDKNREKHFLEANIFRTQSGRIIGLFRTQSDYMKPGVDFEKTYLNLHIAVSDDDGRTFGPVQEIPDCWCSSPCQALQLKSGNVLLSYGYRREPFGIRARLVNAELTNISEAEELILFTDAPNGDLGYPHAIQLDDGEIIVSYYVSDPDEVRVIGATRLREEN